MDNSDFLKCIARSFRRFVETTSRSNEKLKVLHGEIAADFSAQLGSDYTVSSLGFGDGKEGKIAGRYINKNVDITIYDKENKAIAGIGVKFVMQNYSQNSNNYFENMLGETANIRSANIPYFQIFIIPDKIPYYKKSGTLEHWETFSEHNAEKYFTLSKDNIETFLHTPTKTLLYVVKLPEAKPEPQTQPEYNAHYKGLSSIEISETKQTYSTFGGAIILNDYETFLQKVIHYIKSI